MTVGLYPTDRASESVAAIPDEVLAAGSRAAGSAYVYDLELLRKRCRAVQEACTTPSRVFFATMANDHPLILACVRECGVGAFVNSMAHLQLVLGLGFEPSNVVFAASNMTAAEMDHCIEAGVTLVLDSLGQLRVLTGVTTQADVGIRLSVGSALDRRAFQPDPSYRFGLVRDELPEAVDVADRYGIRIVGAHSYFGTDVMDPGLLLAGLESLRRATAGLPDISYVDVGGGFGVPDEPGQPEFDLAAYGRGADMIMATAGRGLELYIEPGRYLAATCGFFFVKVVDVKRRADRVFVGTNGCVANFPRPLMYPDRARHPCELVGANGSAADELPVYVCGNSTYSQDFLARGIALPPARPGDTLVFHNAGAYGRSMITSFLGRDRPEEIVVDSGREC